MRAAPSSVGLPPIIVSEDRWPSAAVAVGQSCAFCLSVGRKSARECAVAPLVPSCALAVGHKPEPFTLVRGTNGGRGEQTPFRIEPEAGKVSEDMG